MTSIYPAAGRGISSKLLGACLTLVRQCFGLRFCVGFLVVVRDVAGYATDEAGKKPWTDFKKKRLNRF